MKPALIFSVLAFSVPVFAAPENTRQACTDNFDNDQDGRIDCADQDCWDLTICANLVPGSTQDPSSRKSGYTKLVLGAVLLPLGVVVAAVSAAPWVIGGDSGSSRTKLEMYAAAGTLDGLGVIAIAAGTALLAVGVGEIAASHDRRVQIRPGVGSLSVTF